MKTTPLTLYRLTVAVLLTALVVTGLAYRNADTARREALQMQMLRQADAERLREENARLRSERDDLFQTLEGIRQMGPTREESIRRGTIRPGAGAVEILQDPTLTPEQRRHYEVIRNGLIAPGR